jgi:hypothetical protein
MKQFIAISGSSIFDVCMNTYGTLNHLVKLMVDSEHDGITTAPVPGQVFLYDENLVNTQTDQSLFQNYSVAAGDAQIKFATRGA